MEIVSAAEDAEGTAIVSLIINDNKLPGDKEQHLCKML